MNDSLDKILKTVENIAFTSIGFLVAIYLINVAATMSPPSYGKTLLEGLSVFYVIAGTILLLWVVYNVINIVRIERLPPRKRK